ncbi:MAG: Uma2 family endonuclease [Synechococcales cyanobacterium RM1_1_8]|nr:Uma2 family endonuclease [Synechococcales cyanobacterium RM1_1_8]
MTTAIEQRMGLDEYLAYDDGTDRRYELIDGVLVEMGAESTINIQIATFLLIHFVSLGVPYYLITSKTEVAVPSRFAKTRYPDLMVMTEELEAAMEASARSIVLPEMPAPRLVVEVVSPGEPGEENYDRDYVEKRREYAARGISEYWIVDPTHRVIVVLVLEGEVYRELGVFGEGECLKSAEFEDLALTVEQVLRAGREPSGFCINP